MAIRIHPVNQGTAHAPLPPTPLRGKRPAPTSSSTLTSGPTVSAAAASTVQTPSFTAVFAQIAAAAAAAGTTFASTAPGSAAPAANATLPAAVAGVNGPAGPVFGADPWLSDPTGQGPNGVVTHYNPIYFATQQTAQTVAQMVGGKVVQANQICTAPGSPFTQNEANYMVQLPDGAQVNPGLIADIYTHGWPQSMVDQQVANEVAGAEAAVGA